MLAQLVPVDGGDPITIEKDVTLIGRQGESCDLIIDRKSVSKIHCILVKTDGLLFVRDLSSTNGTKVNGQRIMRGALLPGDQLAVASEKFRVHLGPDDQPVVSGIDRTEMLDSIKLPPVEKFSRNFDSSSDVAPAIDVDDLVE